MQVKRIDELRELRESGELSDICVIVQQVEFRLHKFPLFLNSDFFRALCRCGMIDEDRVELAHFPGGAKTFSVIVDYCYGEQIDINYSNVAELRCAAEFLQMTSRGNLASEASVALSKILRSPQLSISMIGDIILRCCRLGAIAKETNIISSCFTAVLEVWRTVMLPEAILEVLQELPVDWFVGLVVGARDNMISISSVASLVGRYLANLVKERRRSIKECLGGEFSANNGCDQRRSEFLDGGEDFNLGEVLDFILLELPEKAPLSEVMDGELLCLLFGIAERMSCKCQGILIRAVSAKLNNIPREMLASMPTYSIVSIAEHIVQNNVVPPTALCDILDKYLWDRLKLENLDLEDFQAVTQVIPKDYRQQYDFLLLIAQELFSTKKTSEETMLRILEDIEPQRLHEETLKQVSEKKVIPSNFVVSSALAVSSRLRNELTEARDKLERESNAMHQVHATVSDLIKGQWESKGVILNVTPKDAHNTRVQFAKVLSRNTSTELSMEHEACEGKLTLCVRSLGAEHTEALFLFDPFNEQLLEIKRSKYDNLMVGENYKKKNHTTSYWPFTDFS